MSEEKTGDDPLIDNAAFDYVAGTLRGHERSEFERALAVDPALRTEVHFWEEQLMGLNTAVEEVPPDPAVWIAIEKRIRGLDLNEKRRSSVVGIARSRWPWLSAAAAMLVVATVMLGLWLPRLGPPVLNADYVAVLTGDGGMARLTALTSDATSTLWLDWSEVTIEPDSNLQLWALSRRDGQIRPVMVFADTSATRLSLSEANLRLIRDAAELLLTREEVGGSAIDEPSDELVARGVCVRLGDNSTNAEPII